MKRRSFVSLIAAAFARAQEPPQPAASASIGFTIAGAVVNAANNAPIGKGMVRIASTNDRSQYREVVTGPDGRFSFTNLPAHKFELSVMRQNGQMQRYLSHGNYSSAIVTGPDQNTGNIVFRFHMPGVLAGAVQDESNEPVQEATVHLFSRQVDADGILRLTPASAGTGIRSSGHFRVPHLPPGEYIVAVSAKPWFADQSLRPEMSIHHSRALEPQRLPGPQLPRADPQFDVAYPFTYYPGTTDYASATPILIKEGAESAVELRLRAVPAITVRLTGGDTRPDVGTVVMVASVGPDGGDVAPYVNSFAQNGQGEISGIAPGRYAIRINTFNNGPRTAARFGESHSEPSRRLMDLVDGSVVDLTSAGHISVKAVITVTGTGERPKNRIGLQLRDLNTGNSTYGAVDDQDTVRFPAASLYSGRYQLFVANTPLFRILTLEAKGAKVSGRELVIEDNADVQLSVSIGRRSAISVEGFAMRESSPVVGAMVLLLPKASALEVAIYRDQSDSDGSFSLQNVAAGTYLALAIDDGHDLAFGEAAIIKPYLEAAITVTIDESARPASLTVPVQQRLA